MSGGEQLAHQVVAGELLAGERVCIMPIPTSFRRAPQIIEGAMGPGVPGSAPPVPPTGPGVPGGGQFRGHTLPGMPTLEGEIHARPRPTPPPPPSSLPTYRQILAQTQPRIPAGVPEGGQFLPRQVPTTPWPNPVGVSPVLSDIALQIGQAEAAGEHRVAAQLREAAFRYVERRGGPGFGVPLGPPEDFRRLIGTAPPTIQQLSPGLRLLLALQSAVKKSPIAVPSLVLSKAVATGNIIVPANTAAELGTVAAILGPPIGVGASIGGPPGAIVGGVIAAGPVILKAFELSLQKPPTLPAEESLTARDPLHLSVELRERAKAAAELANELEALTLDELDTLIGDLSAKVTGPIHDC